MASYIEAMRERATKREAAVARFVDKLADMPGVVDRINECVTWFDEARSLAADMDDEGRSALGPVGTRAVYLCEENRRRLTAVLTEHGFGLEAYAKEVEALRSKL